MKLKIMVWQTKVVTSLLCFAFGGFTTFTAYAASGTYTLASEKSRNCIIYTLFSALAGTLSISFVNLDILGIDFTVWVFFATFLLLFIGAVGLWIYSCSYFESTKKKYEIMIRDLEDLKLLKY